VKERGAVENAEAPTTSRQDAATDFIMVEVACCVERVEEDPRHLLSTQRGSSKSEGLELLVDLMYR